MDNLLVEGIVSLVSFVVGIITGYFGRGMLDKRVRDIGEENRFVLVVVTVMWAFSVIVDIVSPNYETSPLIHGLMGAIVGFFFKPWERSK